MGLAAKVEQQIKLFRKEGVIVLKREAEERERLDKGATAHHHLRPPPGQEVKRGKLLENAHRVGCAEHRDSAGEADVSGSGGCSRKEHRRRRVEILLAVMLADPEHLSAWAVDALRTASGSKRPVFAGYKTAPGVSAPPRVFDTPEAAFWLDLRPQRSGSNIWSAMPAVSSA